MFEIFLFEKYKEYVRNDRFWYVDTVNSVTNSVLKLKTEAENSNRN